METNMNQEETDFAFEWSKKLAEERDNSKAKSETEVLIPAVTLEVGINEIRTNIIERFDASQARERLVKYFKQNKGMLQYNGVLYERDLIIQVEVIAEFNSNIICSEIFVCEELLPEREYHEKFSNALIALTIIQDSLVHARKDIEFLDKYDTDEQKYTKTRLKEDFTKIEKSFEIQHKYMLELVKELQKTYKMY